MDHPARVELAKLVLQTNLGPFELGWKLETGRDGLPVLLLYHLISSTPTMAPGPAAGLLCWRGWAG